MAKGIFGRLFGGSKPASPTRPAAAAPAAPERMITAYDANGRQLQIPLSAWRESVLKPGLLKAWDNADALASQIGSALNDDCAADVMDASRRLLEIDSDPERAHILRGATLLRNGRTAEAAKVFQAGVAKVGETGALLTNIARTQWEDGERTLAEATLWRALQRDPNRENGLSWWLSLQRERGDGAYRDALLRAEGLEGAWRPWLWDARLRLQQKDIQGAMACYDTVLARENLHGDALLMMSGDLGQNGLVEMIPEMVAPRYRPAEHGVQAGLNLLQAYLDLERPRDGEALLDQLYRLNLAPYRATLDRYAAGYQEQLRKLSPPKPVDMANLEIHQLVLDLPIWCFTLRNPVWLLPEKPAEAPAIAFMALTRVSSDEEGQEAQAQREDAAGRLTRTIPLYLSEATHNWTALRAESMMPVVKGGGPAVFGGHPDVPAIWKTAPEHIGYLMVGQVAGDESAWSIDLELWARDAAAPVFTERLACADAGVPAELQRVEAALLAHLQPAPVAPWGAFYARPTPEALPHYLGVLAQCLILTLTANDLIDKDTLWGERGMLDAPLQLKLATPELGQLDVAFVSGLAKAALYGSTVLAEYRDRAIDAVRRAAPGDPLARLAPLVRKVLDLPEEPAADTDPRYGEWLERVAAPYPPPA
jgi:hypothetical protein